MKEMAVSPDVVGEIINIGPDEEVVTILELAQKIAFQLDFQLDPVFVKGRPNEVKTAVCASDKARRLLGYKTKTSLDEGLAKIISFIRERGTRQFNYHIELEIQNQLKPRTWSECLF